MGRKLTLRKSVFREFHFTEQKDGGINKEH